MEDLKFKIEDEGLWVEDRHSKFEDSIRPHLHFTHVFLFILCRESRYLKDIVKHQIFRLRMIHNFFQVCTSDQSVFSISAKNLELSKFL